MAYCRIDHGKELIHFTKDAKAWDYLKSYNLFYQIIKEGKLNASTTDRLGSIPTVCFTEAPYSCLTDGGKMNYKYFSRYSPFGFQFSKAYIYDMGGLPVLYSPTPTFERDNALVNWRTVSFDPISKFGEFRDYTWEREWRIQPENNELILDPKKVKLIFPSDEWAEKFRNDHDQFHTQDECDCQCTREAEFIEYDRYHSKEEHGQLSGTCPIPEKFPWVLLSMNCNNVPKPPQDESAQELQA